MHEKRDWVCRFDASINPHAEHRSEVCAGGTAMSMTPDQAALYSRFVLAIDQPFLKMTRFRPALALTLRPGSSSVPAAEAVMRFTAKSSMAMIA